MAIHWTLLFRDGSPLCYVLLLLHCGLITSFNLDNWNADNNVDHFSNNTNTTEIPIEDKCTSFFREYSKYAGDFSACELSFAQPFRMCVNCVEEYTIMLATFTDLVTETNLEKCRIKYMKSDRVQIIPIVQKNVEDIWTVSACAGCFKNITLDPVTKKVQHELPESVIQFLYLYYNLSSCMNTTLEEDRLSGYTHDVESDVCSLCLQNYTDLNDHYNSMTSEYDGNICMDIVDRMNYTRLIWSYQYNCSCHESEPAAVIVITLVVASFPLFFYIALRLTGKEKKTKVVKQKRLTTSMGGDMINSHHHPLRSPNSYGAYNSLMST